MSKFNFSRLCVVIYQHTSLDIVEVNLENKNMLICFCGISCVKLQRFKMTQEFNNQKAFTFQKSSKEISEDYTVIMPTRLWILSQSNNKTAVSLKKKKSTLCTLMEGNMFWNMEAMSLTCMPSDEKLLRMSSGWCVNCCSCIRCFFRVETTSLMREYCKKRKSLYKNWEKLKVINDFFSSGTSVRLLWKHH